MHTILKLNEETNIAKTFNKTREVTVNLLKDLDNYGERKRNLWTIATLDELRTILRVNSS